MVTEKPQNGKNDHEMRKSAEFQGRGRKPISLPCNCQPQARDTWSSYCTVAWVPKARKHPPQTTAQKPQTAREEPDLGPAVPVSWRRNANTDYSPRLWPGRKGMLPKQIIPHGCVRKRVRSLPSAKASNQANHQTHSNALYSSTLHSSSYFLTAVSL